MTAFKVVSNTCVKAHGERVDIAKSYFYAVMRKSFDSFIGDEPQKFAMTIKTEIGIRRERERVERERAAEAAPRGLIERMLG